MSVRTSWLPVSQPVVQPVPMPLLSRVGAAWTSMPSESIKNAKATKREKVDENCMVEVVDWVVEVGVGER